MIKIKKKKPFENVDYELSNGILLFKIDWSKEKLCYINGFDPKYEMTTNKNYSPIYNLGFELIGFDEV